MIVFSRALHAPLSLPARRRTGLWTWIRQSADLARQRRQLAGLESHRLDDIGLTRQEALQEAERPLWDAPDHWR